MAWCVYEWVGGMFEWDHVYECGCTIWETRRCWIPPLCPTRWEIERYHQTRQLLLCNHTSQIHTVHDVASFTTKHIRFASQVLCCRWWQCVYVWAIVTCESDTIYTHIYIHYMCVYASDICTECSWERRRFVLDHLPAAHRPYNVLRRYFSLQTAIELGTTAHDNISTRTHLILYATSDSYVCMYVCMYVCGLYADIC